MGTWSTVAATKTHASAADRTRALRARVDSVLDILFSLSVETGSAGPEDSAGNDDRAKWTGNGNRPHEGADHAAGKRNAPVGTASAVPTGAPVCSLPPAGGSVGASGETAVAAPPETVVPFGGR
ncbi:hypothetical protein GCM10023088_32650 [Actinomadura verrucosospora]